MGCNARKQTNNKQLQLIVTINSFRLTICAEILKRQFQVKICGVHNRIKLLFTMTVRSKGVLYYVQTVVQLNEFYHESVICTISLFIKNPWNLTWP